MFSIKRLLAVGATPHQIVKTLINNNTSPLHAALTFQIETRLEIDAKSALSVENFVTVSVALLNVKCNFEFLDSKSNPRREKKKS